MEPSFPGSQTVKQWFDDLDDELRRQAERAGILEHGTMTGNAREFFVRQALGSFLPRGLHAGTGRVIGARGETSNQIDVVIFDDLYPAFRLPDGQALFPIEGVVSTIEVKSRIDTTELMRAISNCYSVFKIGANVNTRDWKRAVHRGVEKGWDDLIAQNAAFSHFAPSTYIYGFDGFTETQTLEEAMERWLEENQIPPWEWRRVMPATIVAGKVVATVYGRQFTMSQTISTRIDSQEPVDFGKSFHHFLFKREDRPFSWLAANLLHDINRWIRRYQVPGQRRELAAYLPHALYFSRENGGFTTRAFIPDGPTPPYADLPDEEYGEDSPYYPAPPTIIGPFGEA